MPKYKWTKQAIKIVCSEARGHLTVSQFVKKYSAAYSRMLKYYPELLEKYFPDRRKPYTKEFLIKFLKINNIKTISQLEKINPSLYNAARRFFPEFLPIPLYKQWNLELVKKEAKKYKYKSEFNKGSPGAYNWARQSKYFEKICKHMRPKATAALRHIYVYEFSDKKAYIGLTYSLKNRHHDHTTPNNKKKSKVFLHLKTGVSFKFKVLQKNIDFRKATAREDYWIRRYKKTEWKLLNSEGPRHSLGNFRRYYRNNSIAIASKYKSRSDLEKAVPGAFMYLKKHNLLDKVLPKIAQNIKILWVEENKTFNSIGEASRSLGMTETTVRRHIVKPSKSLIKHKNFLTGYTFKRLK